MGKEFELKYRATPKQLAAIQEAFDAFREIAMETTYYDTPDGSLSQRNWMLRRRMENGVSLCTLKAPGENNIRMEWETECADIADAAAALCKLGAPAELEALTAKGLTKVCGARFIRQAALITGETCTVELALDRGILQGGARIDFLREVEVELKSGSEAGAIAFANDLAGRFGLIPENASKYQRALALSKLR